MSFKKIADFSVFVESSTYDLTPSNPKIIVVARRARRSFQKSALLSLKRVSIKIRQLLLLFP